MEVGRLIFDPLMPWPVLWLAIAVAVIFAGVAVWRGLRGWWLRALALAMLLLAVANPSVQIEEREPLTDIILLVVDESASQGIDVRPGQIAETVARVEAEIAALGNTELRLVSMGDADGNRGTLLMQALSEAMAEEPRARLAGAILLSDGQLHDIEALPEMPAPLHLFLTGEADDWDRRLLVENAPAFAIGLAQRLSSRVRNLEDRLIESSGAEP